MKSMTILFALLIGSAVNASRADINDSWRTLGRTNSVIFRMPQLQFSNWFLRVNKTCVEGSKLRSLKRVKKCDRYGGGDSNRCVSERRLFVYRDLQGTETRCTRWQDRGDSNTVFTRYEDVDFSIATEYQIPVYRRVNGGPNGDDFDRSSSRRPLFTKTFRVPSCN